MTGAAGEIGREVLAVLTAAGIETTALVLDQVRHPLPAGRLVVGDAGDPAVVDDALRGVDAVVHLAALRAPDLDTAERVFGRNTLATFVVLEQAGRAGVVRAAIASSYAVCGLPFAVRPLALPYLPIDRHLPLQVTDPYALSKRTDEATAEMAALRHGMTVVALRLPFVAPAADRLPAQAARYADEPAAGAAEVWSYLDTRDAARAMVCALSPTEPGAHVVYVAAPDTLAPYPTQWLVDRFHPGAARAAFGGRTVPIDLAPARELLDFTAEHPWPVAERVPPEDP